MKGEGTGSGHLCLFLLASLLVHLGIGCAVTGGRGGAGGREQMPAAITVEYLDLSTGTLQLPLPGGEAAGGAAAHVTDKYQKSVPLATSGVSVPQAHPVAFPQPREDPSAQGATPGRVVETGQRPGADPAGFKAAGAAASASGYPATVANGSFSGTGLKEGPAATASKQRSGEGTPVVSSSDSNGSRRGSYQQQLKSLIESHKKYPLAARRSRQEGSCVRRFSLGRDGALKAVESVSSCGHPFLDGAATSAVTSVGKFPRLPEEFGVEESFSVTITFTLAGN